MPPTKVMPLKLQIKIGHEYKSSSLVKIAPNDDDNPILIDTPYFTGRVCVRIRDFTGIVPENKKFIKNSPYFEGNSERYSIQVQGRFKGGQWSADDILFGNDFDQKVNLPPLSWVGLKILQYIDPGLEADIYADKPWAYSPLLLTMNTVRLTEISANSQNSELDPDLSLPPWPSRDGNHVSEGELIIDQKKRSWGAKQRQKLFSNKENRKNFKVHENQVWDLDFHNPYADFDKIGIRLPGFNVGVGQYWDGQPLRYVCKTRDSKVVFFVILLELSQIDEKEDLKDKEDSEISDDVKPKELEDATQTNLIEDSDDQGSGSGLSQNYFHSNRQEDKEKLNDKGNHMSKDEQKYHADVAEMISKFSKQSLKNLIPWEKAKLTTSEAHPKSSSNSDPKKIKSSKKSSKKQVGEDN
ncbi:hypothetical protein G9A89_004741 [Geosiphon pyriformis]|nr:hypothetical protein G9A89_004741 [Geosiphon pyriformis]